jgi:hypothetical protein
LFRRTSRSSPTMRSQASRRLAAPPLICRRNGGLIRVGRVTRASHRLTRAARTALAVSRARVKRRRGFCRPAYPPRPPPPSAQTGLQRRDVLDLMHASRFADQAPGRGLR